MLAGEIDQCKDKIKESMKPIQADSILDIRPILNSIIKFDIEFLNLEQRPIKCAQRRIPQHLKDDVNVKLDALVQVGIIRKSKSTWAFLFH